MQLSKKEQYISIDVETTGPVPGLNSMIDLGACVVGDLNNTFSASLVEDHNSRWNTETRKWWMSTDHKRRVLSQIEERAKPIEQVMVEFKQWLAQFNKPVLIGFPAGFDFSFVHFYWWKFIGKRPPFGHRCLDGKTVAMCVFKCPYNAASKEFMKKKFPQGFRNDLPHTHFAVDDAREQAFLAEKLFELV